MVNSIDHRSLRRRTKDALPSALPLLTACGRKASVESAREWHSLCEGDG